MTGAEGVMEGLERGICSRRSCPNGLGAGHLHLRFDQSFNDKCQSTNPGSLEKKKFLNKEMINIVMASFLALQWEILGTCYMAVSLVFQGLSSGAIII